jgi:hypothetical protein
MSAERIVFTRALLVAQEAAKAEMKHLIGD